MYQTKAAIQSVAVISQLLAMAIIIFKMNGVDISADVAGVPEHIGHIIDSGVLLSLEVTALWGRLRANKRISGILRPTE